MSIAKKGLRKTVVNNHEFVYKTSNLKRKSEWRFDKQEAQEQFDETFVSYARYYGLGSISNATINIVVQSSEYNASRLFIKCHTLLVDGFMGIEQVIQITPKLVAQIITKSLADGWQITDKKDIHRYIAHQVNDKKSPYIILFPWATDGDELLDYDNLVKLEPIKIDSE